MLPSVSPGSFSPAMQAAPVNQDLVRCIEELREKREEVNRGLLEDESEKAKIQQDLHILTKRLAAVNDAIARKAETRHEFDKVITETEGAYMKILESSQTLLTVLRRESANIQRKQQHS